MRLLFEVYAPEQLPGDEWRHSAQILPELRQLTQQLLLGDVYGVGPLHGLGTTLLERSPGNAPALVPLYADIAAGLGEEQDARSEPRDSLEVPQHILASDPSAYALRVRGDSMAPLLLEGDVVVVSPALLPEEGCLVAAYVDPDGDVVKRFEWAGESASSSFKAQHAALQQATEDSQRASYLTPEALLKPQNPAYPVIRIGGELGRPARIWGRIVLLLREF
jgi:SOS-response transcriptional repressor LexA